MSSRLTWNEIKARYDREWIELVDCDWPEGDQYPLGGVVRVHAAEKKVSYAELNQQLPKPEQSTLLFVGQPARPKGAMYATPFVFRPA